MGRQTPVSTAKQNTLAILVGISKYFLVAGAILYVLVYVAIACSRMNYPYELEWMEGGSVDHVRRILSGQELYIEPSLEFTPYAYTPLYFYVCALVSKCLGVGFFPLRLVSFISSVGCFVLIFEFVRRQTNSLICAALSTCIYAATYRMSGAWLDIARVDSLFMLLLLASAYLLRYKQRPKFLVVSGILMGLSFLTKQTALVVAGPLVIYSLIALNRWHRFVFPATFLLLVGLSTAVLDWRSGGWYSFYVFHLPQRHPIVKHMILNFWIHDIGAVSIAFCVSLFYLSHQLLKSKNSDFLYFSLLFAGMLAASWLSRLSAGGYNNVLLPIYAAIAICFGAGLGIAISAVRPESAEENDQRAIGGNNLERRHLHYELPIFLTVMVQFLGLCYNPFKQVPTKADLQAGRRFLQLMRDTEGDVFVPFHGFIPSLADKKTYAHRMARIDVFRAKDRAIGERVRNSVRQAIRAKRFQMIITDSPWFAEQLEKHYNYEGPVFSNPHVFYTVTGLRTRPESVFVRKHEDGGSHGAADVTK